MGYEFTRYTGFNKKIFSLALIFSVFINLVIIYFYGYTINNVEPLKIAATQQPKVKFIEVKKEKLKNIKKVRKSKNANKAKSKKINSQVTKSKPSGDYIEKTPVVPLASPVLPETTQINEKEIALPEENSTVGNLSLDKVNIGNEIEYKPVLKGKFNPSFGTKLSKFDETAFGPASGRLVVYKPPPPTIKTKLPPPPKVKVKLWINPDGTVDSVKIVYPKALGDIKLKQIIENYVLSWKFNPISSKDRQWAVTTIRFQSKK